MYKLDTQDITFMTSEYVQFYPASTYLHDYKGKWLSSHGKIF